MRDKKYTKVVLFDFDGVLANTIERSFELHKEINPNLDWQKFKDFSNGNFFDGLGKAVKEGHHLIPKDFFTHYDKHIKRDNLHEILRDTIKELATKYILVIVSSTRDSSIKIFLEKEGIDPYFAEVLGTDIHTSKVLKIQSVFVKYGIQASDAVFITDTLGDMREAKECGVVSIGVLWGLHERENLEKGNPVKIIDNPADLLSSIKDILG